MKGMIRSFVVISHTLQTCGYRFSPKTSENAFNVDGVFLIYNSSPSPHLARGKEMTSLHCLKDVRTEFRLGRQVRLRQ